MSSDVSPVPDTDFFLHIEFVQRERSKDSNQQFTMITVKDQRVTYSWRYTGFPGQKEEECTYVLDSEGMEELITILQEGHLDRLVEEDQPTEKLGHSIELKFTYQTGTHVFQSSVRGMVRFLGEQEGNIEDTSFIEGVEDIISIIKIHRPTSCRNKKESMRTKKEVVRQEQEKN
jgi:hypothetical protein